MDLTAIENYLKQVLTGANPGGDPTDIAATAAKLAGQPGAADAVAPLAAPSSDFDVSTPDNTITQNGSPQSLPSQGPPSAPQNGQDALPSLSPTAAPSAPPVVPSAATPSPAASASLPSKAPSGPATASSPATPTPDLMASSDQATRQAQLAAAQRKANLTSAIGGSIAGLGDTLAGGLRAFGEAPGESAQDKVIANAQEQLKTDKANIETGISNDPNSAASQNARQLVLQIAPQMANQPGFNQMTDQELRDKLPLVDTMMKAKASEDTKKVGMAQAQATRDAANGIKSDNQQSKLEQDYDNRLTKMFSNRSGGLGLQDAKVNAAIHSRELIEGARDAQGNVNINQIQSPELAMSLASIVSGGNAPALETMKAMTPESLSGFIKSKVGYLVGKPVDVIPAPWVASLTQQLDRQGLTSEALRNQEMKAMISTAPSQLDPDTAKMKASSFMSALPSYSQRYGLKPIDITHPANQSGGSTSAPQSSGSTGPARTSAGGYSYTVNQ